ncbi:hypothetical protein Tco_1399597 [Tanacetum coccineum]
MLAIQAEEGEGSGHPSEPQPPPFTAQPTHEEPIPNVVSSSHQKTQTPRQALNQVTELSQTSEPIPNVPDKAVYEEWDDRVKRVITTAASLDAQQASGNINRTQSTTMPNVPLPQGIGAGGSLRCQEAMGVPLLRLVESLEEDLKQTKQVYGVAYTKLIMKREDQPEDQLGVLSAAKILADASKTNVHIYTRRRVVSTGSGGISTASRLFSTTEESVSTAGASMPVSTAGMVQEVNISIPSPVVIKDKAQSFTEEEWENIRARVEADEELSRRLQAEERNKYSEVDQAKMLVDLINQRKKYFVAHKAELKELFETTMKNVNTFIPTETEDRGRASELAAGSSQATIIDSAEVRRSVQEQPKEEEKELSQEDLQQMMMVDPVEEVYVEALQVKYPIIDWEDDLVIIWNLVKERFSSTEPTDDKERTLWVELNRMLVEQHSEMANDLLRKIFIQANRPRQ